MKNDVEIEKNINFNGEKLKSYLILHLVLLLYSFIGILSKIASKEELFSMKFIVLYVCILAVLFLYAIFWQKILSFMNLTTAFANKSAVVIWGMLWGSILFGESISFNQIFGSLLIIIGIILVVKSD